MRRPCDSLGTLSALLQCGQAIPMDMQFLSIPYDFHLLIDSSVLGSPINHYPLSAKSFEG